VSPNTTETLRAQPAGSRRVRGKTYFGICLLVNKLAPQSLGTVALISEPKLVEADAPTQMVFLLEYSMTARGQGLVLASFSQHLFRLIIRWFHVFDVSCTKENQQREAGSISNFNPCENPFCLFNVLAADIYMFRHQNLAWVISRSSVL
jgi:hypothetical protein